MRKNILRILGTATDEGVELKEICGFLGLTDTKSRNLVVKVLDSLIADENVVRTSDRRFKSIALSKGPILEGRIEINSQGNGYVTAADYDRDIFIPSAYLNTALNGDTVTVEIIRKKKGGVPQGAVHEVLLRKRTTFVGVFMEYENFGFVRPKDSRSYKDIFIPAGKTGNAKNGEVVVVEFMGWEDPKASPTGKIVQCLGEPGQQETEIHSILAEYGLPADFSPEVLAAAAALDLTISQDEIDQRRDFRSVLTFTIDPKDAKDFDDALSFRLLENGNFEIGIHIADVSHYVEEGNVLDDEALNRATSVYLVDRVVPMLPEVLSNEACSLRPHEEKLTYSAVFELDTVGSVKNRWFGRTVIYSDCRLSYEEAQLVIDSGNGYVSSEVSLDGVEKIIREDVVFAILELNSIAKGLRKKRMANGAISFDKIEVKFNLDKEGMPLGVYFKESKEANKLIEEFMLLANKSVAEFVGKGQTAKTFVYRVHDEPDLDKLYNLNGIVDKLGYALNFTDSKALNTSLNQLLAEVKGKGEQNLVDTLAIRSMSKAAYSTNNIGHYGLAFDFYTHFTSPIRRYPDIMVHRLLTRYLANGSSVNEELMEFRCKHSTDMEILASSAERESIKFMQVKYMSQHVDRVFEGVISGVTEWGLYVELLENKCEGMVRIRDIKGDYFVLDPQMYALVGERTKKKYQLGDVVFVKIKATDVVKRHLDFFLVESRVDGLKKGYV